MIMTFDLWSLIGCSICRHWLHGEADGLYAGQAELQWSAGSGGQHEGWGDALHLHFGTSNSSLLEINGCFHKMVKDVVMWAYKYIWMKSDISMARETYSSEKRHALFVCVLQDPAIAANETKGSYPAFDTGIEKDVFIKWPSELSSDIVWGKVWQTKKGRRKRVDCESIPHSLPLLMESLSISLHTNDF